MNSRLLAGHALFIVAALTSIVIAPESLQLVLYVDSGGANEVVLPLGFAVATLLWAWFSLRSPNTSPPGGLLTTIAIAMVVGILLLTSTFARQLADPSGFSTRFYWIYARLFCGAAVAAGTWRSLHILRMVQNDAASPAILELPVVAGVAILVVALGRYDVMIAAAGLALGLGAALLAPRPAGLRLAALARVLLNERVFLALIFIAAVAVRLLYLQRVMSDPDYLNTGGDGAAYDAVAWSIAQGNGVPQAFRDGYPLLLLGYVWFVAGLYAIAGHSYFVVGAAQAVVGASACVVLYFVGKSLFGVSVARVASAFAAVSFPLIFAAAAIGHQAVDVFLTLLAVWLLLRMSTRPESTAQHVTWRWAAIGVVFGCLIAVRETNAFFLFFVVCWMAAVFRRWTKFDRFRATAAVAVGVVVVILPLMMPTISSADGRLRLRQHFDRLYQGQGDVVRTRKNLVGPLEDPKAAFAQFREQPRTVAGTLIRSIVHNFSLQFFTQPYGGFDLVFLSKGSAYYYGQWFYAYALAVGGLIAIIRLGMLGGIPAAGAALVIGVVASRTVPHLVLESHYRHRVPIEPFLILMTSLAAVRLVESIRALENTPRRIATEAAG